MVESERDVSFSSERDREASKRAPGKSRFSAHGGCYEHSTARLLTDGSCQPSEKLSFWDAEPDALFAKGFPGGRRHRENSRGVGSPRENDQPYPPSWRRSTDIQNELGQGKVPANLVFIDFLPTWRLAEPLRRE